MTGNSPLKLIRGETEHIIYYDQNDPPHVFFDTNVWRGMNDQGINTLKSLQQKLGFQYRYSVTNFVEFVSHLKDPSSNKCQDPFSTYRSCFVKIEELCDPQILPSPEMEFLVACRLNHYIHQDWIVDTNQMALKVKSIAKANDYKELNGILNIFHYNHLSNIDQESMGTIFEELKGFNRPITTAADSDKLIQWFMRLAEFFLLVRPSNGKVFYRDLKKQEQLRFQAAFTQGAGRLFYSHCFSRVKKVVNECMKIDPNDLYDMLQLILLENSNLLFITNDKSFFNYQIDDSQIQRVLPWESFRESL